MKARSLFLGAVAGGFILRRARRIRRRMSFNGKSVLITGGSRGLGLELARRFAREGARLSLLARDADELARAQWRLESTFGADVQTWACDLRNAEQVEQVADEVIGTRGGVDVLINNAGVIRVGPFLSMSMDDFQEALDVHLTAPLRLIHKVVPGMMQRRAGRIVNVSSIAGLIAVPHLAPYVASKFALTGLSETMTAELAAHGVYVTTVCPGLMRTGSHVNALFRGDFRREFAWFSWMGANPMLSTSSAHAARRIVDACRNGRPRLSISAVTRLADVADSVAPGVLATMNSLAASVLPTLVENTEAARPGWQSTSRAAPSVMTRLADRQIERNNELDAPHAIAYRSARRSNGRNGHEN